MIDNLEEYEDVQELIRRYKEELENFKKDKKQKPRIDAIKSEIRNLEAELIDFNARQKNLN